MGPEGKIFKSFKYSILYSCIKLQFWASAILFHLFFRIHRLNGKHDPDQLACLGIYTYTMYTDMIIYLLRKKSHHLTYYEILHHLACKCKLTQCHF